MVQTKRTRRDQAAVDSENWKRHFLERARDPEELSRPLKECDIWATHGDTLTWKAPGFDGMPSFYPVYKWRDYYSHSSLALSCLKGRFVPNPRVFGSADSARYPGYAPSYEVPDVEVTRVGGELRQGTLRATTQEYAHALAQALSRDIEAYEARHPRYTNIIMCGGKDSKNLLLLPWKNPTIVASAQPDFDNVVEFVGKNGLGFEVVELRDNCDAAWKNIEIALNMGQVDMRHFRFGDDLRSLANRFSGRAIFWLGALADAFTTPMWRRFTGHSGRVRRLEGYYSRRSRQVPYWMDSIMGALLQRPFSRQVWSRCASMQGKHLEFIRELTGAMALSAYHGSEAQSVLRSTFLPPVTRYDMRCEIGEALAGKPVWYPGLNPSLPTSVHRTGFHRLSSVSTAIGGCLGVSVVGR